jgi:hypothetical protein
MTENNINNWINEQRPEFIERDIDCHDVLSIVQGGCASGAYMPAVRYYDARKTMAEHGNEVLEFIEERYGELPQVPSGESWDGIAVFFLSVAVEVWACGIEDTVRDLMDSNEEGQDDND